MNNRVQVAPVKLIIIFLTISLLLLTTACQGNQPQTYDSQKQQVRPEVAGKGGSEGTPPGNSRPIEQENTDRKIIKEANLNLVNDNLEPISDKIEQLTADYEGYIAHVHQWEDNQQRTSYSYTIRVPDQHFHSLMANLKSLGQLTQERISREDVTEQYIDLQARIKNLKHQETSYLNLLEKADQVESILKIEKELNRVRTDIERLQGRLDYYQSKVMLATINLHISEPKPIFASGWNLLTSCREAVRGFISSINLIIILTGRLLPWSLLLLTLGWLIYHLIKKIKS